MYNEYLIGQNLSLEIEELILSLKVNLNLEPIGKSKKEIIHISIEKETEENINKLDKIQSLIIEKYPDAIILASNSSKYYNQKLYPLINEMERDLRNLLYLVNILADGKYKKVIQGLEDKDFGKIFRDLFFDKEFMTDINSLFNGGDKKTLNQKEFTKMELLSIIQTKEEKCTWDKILTDSSVPILKENFHNVRKYRNNIMHAHNINQKRYITIKKLYKSINEELKKEIDRIKSDPEGTINQNISEIISKSLLDVNFDAMTLAIALAKSLAKAIDVEIVQEAMRKNLDAISKIPSIFQENRLQNNLFEETSKNEQDDKQIDLFDN